MGPLLQARVPPLNRLLERRARRSTAAFKSRPVDVSRRSARISKISKHHNADLFRDLLKLRSQSRNKAYLWRNNLRVRCWSRLLKTHGAWEDDDDEDSKNRALCPALRAGSFELISARCEGTRRFFMADFTTKAKMDKSARVYSLDPA